jgi:hypothetical protein
VASATAPLSDAGAAADTLSVQVTLTLGDTGSAVDAATGQDNAFVTKFLADAGAASDAIFFVPSLIGGRPFVTGDPLPAVATGDPILAQVTGVY